MNQSSEAEMNFVCSRLWYNIYDDMMICLLLLFSIFGSGIEMYPTCYIMRGDKSFNLFIKP